jgi:hypothetical protein
MYQEKTLVSLSKGLEVTIYTQRCGDGER